jgi:hypothetical protein
VPSIEVGATAEVQERFMKLFTPAAQWTLFDTALRPATPSAIVPTTTPTGSSSPTSSAPSVSLVGTGDGVEVKAASETATATTTTTTASTTPSTPLASMGDEHVPDEEIDPLPIVDGPPSLRTLGASVRAAILAQLRQSIASH